MKTKTIANGKTKVWFDREEEFTVVGKNEPLYDTLIDAHILTERYSEVLVKEVLDAGLEQIHGVQVAIDDSLQNQFDNLTTNELYKTFDEFNSIFKTHLKYHKNSNGLISIIFGEFKDYQEFLQDYFSAFLIKLFAFKIDIIATEDKNVSIKGLSGFVSKFAEDYLKIYLETSRKRKFKGIIRTE
jgi:hypothetical protein